MFGSGGLRQPVNLGPVRVRLTGVLKGESDQNTASVNAPTVAEATAALNRVARVNGADAVVQVSSDHRRTALANGPLTIQTFVEVQAWGTAVQEAEEAPAAQPNGASGEKKDEGAAQEE